ncbi:MAG: response regulator, partial [Candidatus Krumholzibacteria bacterium]|nr:response regulator [Candidatus Krumholzibacteria bacterium]
MSKTVMVIDDDENAVKFLSAVLEENGYETLSAGDGREGLEKLRQTVPDLIILDVMMPKR